MPINEERLSTRLVFQYDSRQLPLFSSAPWRRMKCPVNPRKHPGSHRCPARERIPWEHKYKEESCQQEWQRLQEAWWCESAIQIEESGHKKAMDRVKKSIFPTCDRTSPLLPSCDDGAAWRTSSGVRVRETKSGNENRNRQSDGKFTEEPANDIAHEEERNENGDQRNGQRNDRESNLLGAPSTRPPAALPPCSM